MTYKERLTNLTESKFKVGDVVSYKGKRGKIDEISGDKSSADIIWFDDSKKDTSLPVNVLKKESFREQLDKLSEKNENKYNEISDAQSKIRDITASEFKSKTMQKIFKSLETGKIKGQGVDAAVEIVKILLSSGVITKEDKLLFDKFIKFNYR